jgi:predicted Zn-dependent protease
MAAPRISFSTGNSNSVSGVISNFASGFNSNFASGVMSIFVSILVSLSLCLLLMLTSLSNGPGFLPEALAAPTVAKPAAASVSKPASKSPAPSPSVAKSVNDNKDANLAAKTTDDLIEGARDLTHEYEYKKAEPLLEEAIRREPKNPHFRFIMAKGLIEQGRFEKAMEELLEASFLAPTNNGPRFEIAQIYVYQGRFKDAVTVLEQIKNRVPFTSRDARKAVQALNSIAAYYELGDPYSASYADPEDSTPWQRSDFPIKVAIWSDPEMKDLKAPFRQAVIDAFNRWKDASGGWLRFQIVDDQRQAKIVCKLVGVMRGNKYEGGGEKLGETLGDYDNKNADVLGFSRVEIFWDEDSNPAHLRSTVLHEVGHALGLGHSNNTLDIMYPFVHPPYSEFPSRRDSASIRALYKIKS